jgi:hypothetical protein
MLTDRVRVIKRHDKVCAQLHFNIYKVIRLKLDSKHWYNHVPKQVKIIRIMETASAKNRTISNNKPDVIIRDKTKEHAC